jgi:hypothetical protein
MSDRTSLLCRDQQLRLRQGRHQEGLRGTQPSGYQVKFQTSPSKAFDQNETKPQKVKCVNWQKKEIPKFGQVGDY